MLDAHSAREVLQERLATLLRRGAALQGHLRAQDGRNEADGPDRAAFVEGDEVMEGLDDAGRAAIHALRDALGRLDAGTWGTCTACGGDIAHGRLAARPEAAWCRDCAEARETET
jgi:DnaK suppressor protein